MIDQSNRAGPSGYPSPDPTMGYMMDGQHAAAAAMMQARLGLGIGSLDLTDG